MKIKHFYIILAAGFGIFLTIIWIVGVGASTAAASAVELRVCHSGCPYSSIQAAVDAAQTGDIVKVAEGTYTEMHHIPIMDSAKFTATQMVIVTKTITLRGGYSTSDWSVSDPENHETILDAGGLGRVMVISDTVSPDISGFTMTDGDSTGLGGMFWGDVGGAIYIKLSSPVIHNNQINNSTATYYGGGIYMAYCNATVRDNDISMNGSQDRGGGVHVSDCTTTISGNRFTSNTTVAKGGGICTFWSQVDLVDNIFIGNNAEHEGGGALIYGFAGDLDRNVFLNNHALIGGGLYLRYEWGNVPSLSNTVFVGNQAQQGSGFFIGGDEYTEPHEISSRHMTLHDNNGSEGIYVGMNATLHLTNTIISSHTLGIAANNVSTATMNSTLWYSNTQNMDGSITHVNDHTGNPQFMTDDYHINPLSAARNIGIDAGIDHDIDPNHRPRFGGFDIGADEYQGIYLPMVINRD